MTGITFLKDQILSRSSKKWFDITLVAGTKKARMFLTGLFCVYPVEHAAGNTLELYRAPARARARHEDQIASKTFPGTCWAIILYRISY